MGDWGYDLTSMYIYMKWVTGVITLPLGISIYTCSTWVYGGSNGLGGVGTKVVVGIEFLSVNGWFKQELGPNKMGDFI